MKKFILIICLSLMGFSIASQISFNSGMLSEILKFRIDFDKRSMALEDSENMLVQPEGPIFRRTGTEFIDEALTEFSYTVTDTNDSNDPNTPVYGDYTEYFVGYAPTSIFKPVVKATSDSNINTAWGDSGYWGTNDVNTVYSRDAIQLEDGRLLVPVNYGRVYMLNTDGTTDTSWGTNGYYYCGSGMYSGVHKILVDNDDNFHIFGGVAGTQGEISYIKISADGTTLLGSLTAGETTIWAFQDAQWIDDTKTRIIACGSSVFGFYVDEQYYAPPIVAINPDDCSIDTTWTGNITGRPGFCYPSFSINNALYNMRIMSDGGIVCHNNSDGAFLFKVLSDGSGLDTTWGTNGIIDLDMASWGYGNCREMDNYGDEIFVNARQTVDGNLRCVLYHFDANGTEVSSQVIAGSSQYTYTLLSCFNDKLILGGFSGNAVEIWSQDLVKESGFDIAYGYYAIMWVLPDEETREVTYTGGEGGETTTTTTVFATSDKTRLIPFQFSVSDAYVLEFGNKFVSFLRTQ